MAPQYTSYPGIGTRNHTQYHYSQSVRLGSRIETSGQGGWDPTTGTISPDAKAQIAQAFKNVDLALRDAGGEGWGQVYRVTSYHVPLDEEVFGLMVEGLREWVPGHAPIWTCVGVEALADKRMVVEIEVVAWDEK